MLYPLLQCSPRWSFQVEPLPESRKRRTAQAGYWAQLGRVNCLLIFCEHCVPDMDLFDETEDQRRRNFLCPRRGDILHFVKLQSDRRYHDIVELSFTTVLTSHSKPTALSFTRGGFTDV